jgi:hypothetical protein
VKKKTVFFLIVFICAFITGLMNFLIIFLFRSPHASVGQLLLRVGLPGAGYILLAAFLQGRNAASFDPDRFAVQGEEYLAALKKLGSIPIRMIAQSVLLDLVFLGAIFIQGEKVGIQPEINALVFLAALALGILMGAFVYVLMDSLVSETLISCDLNAYPQDLREDRQTLKLLIIPVVAALLSVLFAFSMALLAIYGTGISLLEINAQAWRTAFILMGMFLALVALLSSILKKNAGRLFGTVIVQLENLSSA